MAQLNSSIKVPPGSHFPIQNLPYGIFIKRGASDHPRPGVAIGIEVLDLKVVADEGHFVGPELSDCFQQNTLSKFISLGRPAWKEARKVIQRLLSDNDPTLSNSQFNRKKYLIPVSQVEMQFPVDIKDFTAFYDLLSRVTKCVKNMGGTDFKVDPNWLSQPLAHLGRSSSVVVSETEILRPREQGSRDSKSEASPYLGPSKKFEFGAIVGPGIQHGNPIDFSKAKGHIFGLVLLNEKFVVPKKIKKEEEMMNFLKKNFGTFISPWIVTLDALEEMAREHPNQNPPPSSSSGTSHQNVSLKGEGYCALFAKISP